MHKLWSKNQDQPEVAPWPLPGVPESNPGAEMAQSPEEASAQGGQMNSSVNRIVLTILDAAEAALAHARVPMIREQEQYEAEAVYYADMEAEYGRHLEAEYNAAMNSQYAEEMAAQDEEWRRLAVCAYAYGETL